jgi:zinc protease
MTKLPPKKVPGYRYIKSSDNIHEYEMVSNGLKVLVMEEHSAPVATFMVTYLVGSRNEAIGHTGATHLLEHLMFKGSKSFDKKKHTGFWNMIESTGAMVNATTWFDRTNYFELLPVEHLEKAMALEADRMRNALLRKEDKDAEMTVVRNEFERGENDPGEALDKQIWSIAYQAHPYHHSTIGWRSDIENVSIERLQEFYDTFYWPNNAVATIIGDIDIAKTLAMAKKYFGKYKKSPHPIPQVYTQEPKQEGQRRVVVRRTGQATIVGIAHKSPTGLHADSYPLKVFSHILGSGKTSRLHRLLVDKGLATELQVMDHLFHDEGLFITYVHLTPGTSPDEVEKIVMDEYERIKKDGVTAAEVKKAQESFAAALAFSRDGAYAIAGNLNEAIATGDWTLYTTFKSKIAKVTPLQVQAIVKKYFVDNQSTVGHFIPIKQ